jgi:hypothetical protein
MATTLLYNPVTFQDQDETRLAFALFIAVIFTVNLDLALASAFAGLVFKVIHFPFNSVIYPTAI